MEAKVQVGEYLKSQFWVRFFKFDALRQNSTLSTEPKEMRLPPKPAQHVRNQGIAKDLSRASRLA